MITPSGLFQMGRWTLIVSSPTSGASASHKAGVYNYLRLKASAPNLWLTSASPR